MRYEAEIKAAAEKYEQLLREQLARVDRMEADKSEKDFTRLDKVVIGVCGGDGIGPIICGAARDILEYLLEDEIRVGKVELRDIEGLTIENRIACGKAIPDDTLEALKACDVILKGPTTTPNAGDGMPNIESANVAMRKALDLYANVRPRPRHPSRASTGPSSVKIPRAAMP